MLPSLMSRCTIIAICLALSACTSSSKDGTNSNAPDAAELRADELPVLGLGANMVPVQQDLFNDSGDNVLDATQDMQDTDDGINDTPLNGRCANTLPCLWTSDDAQFSILITNAANIATRSRLSIQLSMMANHDTDIIVARVGDAITAESTRYRQTGLIIDGKRDVVTQTAEAGTSIDVTIDFNSTASQNHLSTWSIEIIDGGLMRSATFQNIPVGSAIVEQADCQHTLPCVWTTPENDVAITLKTVEIPSSTKALAVGFSIETVDEVAVAVDDGSTASSADGTLFESRVHSIGGYTDYQQLTAIAALGNPVDASVDFYRAAGVPASLDILSLEVYKNLPVPHWNPRFINVPTP